MLTELPYLPPVEFFIRLTTSTGILVEACENFQKQTFRNRCSILGANNILTLTVPVKKKNGKIPIREVEVDDSQSWEKIHWRGISSAYGKAPFFEFFADYFSVILFKKHKFLFDLNMEFLLGCLKLLGLSKEIRLTETFIPVTTMAETGINDMRNVIDPWKKSRKVSDIQWIEYPQLFGKYFAENLSIIDLLFCKGPESLQILRESALKEQ